jgi:cell division septum initiation protein DivIVA
MDIATRIQALAEAVNEAKAMPLSASVLVNRDEVLQLLTEIQEALPDEIKQARWIVKDREDLLAKARVEAERIVEQAQEEQARLARKEAITARATEEAERILDVAEDRARQMQRESEEYADGKLAQLETGLRRILENSQAASRALEKTLGQIEQGREQLRAPAGETSEEPDPGEVVAEEVVIEEVVVADSQAPAAIDGPVAEFPAPAPETPLFDDEERP